MNSKKISSNTNQKQSYVKNSIDVPTSEISDSDTEKLKKLYLPKSKDDYRPDEESIEDANNLQHPKPPSLNSLT